MNIQQIIYNNYFDYNRARKPKNISINPPEPQPYSEQEVSCLIDSIVRNVNSEIAAYHFRRNHEKS